MELPEWLEYLEHTADEGIRVTAPTRETIFERAAWGMFSLLTDLSSVRERTSVAVEVSGKDDVELLIEWLSELNVIHQTRRHVFSGFTVDSIEGQTLKGTVRGEPYDPERHELWTEIKAVTFCDAQLTRTDDHWKAQVIFDV